MGRDEIRDCIEGIAESLLLADPADLQSLAELHTRFQTVAEWAADAALPHVAQAASRSADLIERMILGDTPDLHAGLDVLERAVSAMQYVVRDGRHPDEVDFPAELGLQKAATHSEALQTPSPEPGQTAVAQTPQPEELPAPSSRFTVKLPAYVDDAIFGDFLARQPGVLDEIEELTLTLEGPGQESGLPALRRVLHTLKGESGLLGLADVQNLCHSVEDALTRRPPNELVDALLSVKDWLGRAFDAYAGKGAPPGPVDEVIAVLRGETPPQPKQAPRPARGPESAPSQSLGPRPLEGDMELLGDFVGEANEHLEAADVHLLTLETAPSDANALNAVFRAVHTIKGVAGFLNLSEILLLAHEAENLFDKARKGDLELSGTRIDAAFEAVDGLKQLVGRLSHALTTGSKLTSLATLPGIVERVKAALSGTGTEAERPAAAGRAGPGERLGEILVKTGAASPGAVEEALRKQAHTPPEPKKIGEILVQQAMASRSQVESALDIQAYRPSQGETGEILVEMGAVTHEDVAAALVLQKESSSKARLGEILVREGEASAIDVAHALRSQGPRPGRPAEVLQRKAVQVREAVKVDADRLDQLIDTIGELVIAESMVRGMCLALVSGASNDAGDAAMKTRLARHISQLDKITRELQEMGMSLRMVPIRATFQKMARLVRDLAKKSGKAVDFSMSGEDTELDKTVVDKIGDPLVHMIRNAVDHGIEAGSDERVRASKPSTATVQLRAFHRGGSIYIQVEDDGRGLDRQAIVAKAVERGVVTQSDNLSDREVWNLIFEPGFSTAKTVSDVSGRGVGMDVVRRNVEGLRGQVDIASEAGKGSVFTIRLPLTLAIIDGMVIRVGRERYVIPTLSIVMSVRPRKKDLSSVVGRGEMMAFQGNLLPLFRLARLFRCGRAVQDVTQGTVVVVESEGQRMGLLIDEILGQQQIVIKSLGGALRGIPGVAGGAIMPDGKVGLILDAGGLLKLAHGAHGDDKRHGPAQPDHD